MPKMCSHCLSSAVGKIDGSDWWHCAGCDRELEENELWDEEEFIAYTLSQIEDED